MYIYLIHNVIHNHGTGYMYHTCTCTGHTYRLQNNPQQLTNNNILTMVIHFTNTSPWMITLPQTLSNQSHHTQQLSPFLEPLQLSTSSNIACLFQRVKQQFATSFPPYHHRKQSFTNQIKDEGRYNGLTSLDDDFDPLFTHWVHLKVKNLS